MGGSVWTVEDGERGTRGILVLPAEQHGIVRGGEGGTCFVGVDQLVVVIQSSNRRGGSMATAV